MCLLPQAMQVLSSLDSSGNAGALSALSCAAGGGSTIGETSPADTGSSEGGLHFSG